MARRSNSKTDDPFRQTLLDIAKWFGMSKSAVEEWNLSEDAPKKTSKGYNCREWAAWLAQRKGKPSPKDATEYKLKLVKLEEAQLNLDERKGKFITREQHIREIEQIVSILVQATERGPAELAARTGGRSASENLKTLEAWFTAFRESLSPKQ